MKNFEQVENNTINIQGLMLFLKINLGSSPLFFPLPHAVKSNL